MIEIKQKITGLVLKEIDADDLRWTDLRGADLRDADLIGADLRWADLIGAKITVGNREIVLDK